jgi:hypothetical protein
MAKKVVSEQVSPDTLAAEVKKPKGPKYLLPGNVEVWWGELSDEEKNAIRQQYPAYKDVK